MGGLYVASLRVKAFLIDYVIVMGYVFLLLGVSLSVIRTGHLEVAHSGPWVPELLGFALLTLPVILFFSLSECGRFNATIGKRKMGLVVVDMRGQSPRMLQTLIRNSIKFLPWEIAHFFVYRVVRYSPDTPGWVMAGLYTSMGLALVYFVMIFVSRQHRSLYEILSGTEVVRRPTGID